MASATRLLLVLVLALPGEARADCLDDILGGARPLGRPDGGDAATRVEVDASIVSVRDIQDANNTFVADLHLNLTWHDARLAHAGPICETDGRDAFGDRERIWGPGLEVINRRSLPEVEWEKLFVLPDGTVKYGRRMTLALFGAFDLRRFPFDEQQLRVELESADYPESEVRLLAGHVERADRHPPQWWRFGDTRITVGTTTWQDVPYSSAIISASAERQASHYVWRVLIPLLVIVMVSWGVFWIGSDELESQMQLSVTCLLSVVAFNYVVLDDLPKVPYLSVMDHWILMSYVFVFVGTVENIAAHFLARRGRDELAKRLDRHARWLIPSTFAVLLLASLVGTR